MPVPPAFESAVDADHPGWVTWQLSDDTRFNSVLGKMIMQGDGDIARIRMFPEHVHTNLHDNVHGGVLLAFADVAMFAGAKLLGMKTADDAVTLDLSMQFLGSGKGGMPLDAEVDLLRETGRLVFLRGIISQQHARVAAFSGTLRKATIR